METFKKLCSRFFYLRKAVRKGASVQLLKGWSPLGKGYYGEAWMHEDYPELCLKISGPAGWGEGGSSVLYGIQERGTKRLDGWPVFARHCQANPHEHLPHIIYFEAVSESMSWAIMPCYQPWDWHTGLDVVELVRGALKGYLADVPSWLWPLKQMASGLHMQVDLHGGNIMIDRATGLVIIIDPFSTLKED